MSADTNEVFRQVIDLLEPLSDADRERTIQGAMGFLGMKFQLLPKSDPVGRSNGRDPVFSGHKELGPMDFLAEKNPETDVDRVVCLAYYLSHRRDMKYFNTLDISTLSVEAALPKLSNPAQAVNTALMRGLLVHAPEKQKQLSILGKRYVIALPDIQAAKAVLDKKHAKRKPKRKTTAARS